MKGFRFVFHRDHLIITLGAFLLLWLLRFFAFNVTFLNPVAKALDSFRVTDLFFDIERIGSKPVESTDIAVMDVTDVIDRADLALLLERIDMCNPACIGVDLIFEGRKDDEQADAYLGEVAERISEKAVFAVKLTDYDSQTGAFAGATHSFFTGEHPVAEGYVNFINNLDAQPVRDLSTSRETAEGPVASFPAVLAERYAGRDLGFAGKDFLINYRPVAFPVVSPAEIEEKADQLEGRVVLVGTMHEERDMHNTPLGKMPGVQIQAYSLNTMLGRPVHVLPAWLKWLLAFVLCYLFQVSIEAVFRLAGRKREAASMTFIRESGIMPGLTLLLWTLLLSFVAYSCFRRHGLVIDSVLIIALFALALESRRLYRSLMMALGRKTKCRFVRDSIYNRT